MNSRENIRMNALVITSWRALKVGAALAFTAAVAACSGGGAGTVQNPVTSAPPVADYTGPAPQNADVQAFKLNLWENIKANNRCGGCHNAGGQTPQFARNDDVNAAYKAANTVVNLTQPDQSRMVIKVGGGHNCWLASASACARHPHGLDSQLGRRYRHGRQADPAPGAHHQGSGHEQDVPDRHAPNSWPARCGPMRRTRRASCVATARAAIPRPLRPPQSAVLRQQRCRTRPTRPRSRRSISTTRPSRAWWCACAMSSTTAGRDCTCERQHHAGGDPGLRGRHSAHRRWTPSLVISKALTLYDGTVAAGGNRFDTNVIALYEFKTGTGNVAYDTSGVEPALNLTLANADMWVGGWGINVKAGQKAQGSTTASKKLVGHDQVDRRVHHRGVDGAGERRAGRRLRGELLRRHDGAQRHARPARVPVRSADPHERDGRERRADAPHHATRTATRRPPCSTSCSPTIR